MLLGGLMSGKQRLPRRRQNAFEKRRSPAFAKHRIRRYRAEDVKAALSEPAPIVIPGTPEAAMAAIELFRSQLRLLQDQLTHCGKQMESLLQGDEETELEGCTDQQKDAFLLQTLPGIGPRLTAILLVERAHALRERDYHRLRAIGGTAPITKRSGKKLQVIMRRACNPRLRNGLHGMAGCAIQHDDHWRRMYAEMRGRGHSYGRAMRGIADRMLRVMCAMLESGEVYDPN